MILMDFVNRVRKVMIELDPFHHLFKPTKELIYKMDSKVHYAGDMHIHPNYLGTGLINGVGEGINTISENLDRARKVGIKVLGYTPHFKMHNVKSTINSDEVIIIPGVEITAHHALKPWHKRIKGGHVLVHSYGVTQLNANKVEALSHTLQQNHSTLEQLIKIQDKFNNGCKVINGVNIPECVRQNVKMTVTPAHYSDHRGIKESSIWQVYEDGYDLLSLEVTNATSYIYQDDLAARLRKEYGNSGPADLGGSDAHRMEMIGMGYTSFTRPMDQIKDSLDVFDCIVAKDTTTNYLRLSKFKRAIMSKAQYLNLFYWAKFFPWLATR